MINKSLIYCFALVISVNILFATNPAEISKGFRNYLFDTYQKFPLKELKNTNNVTVINIDENSLSKIGQWPWSRVEVARLVMESANLGASSILVDFIFSEEDRTSPKNVLKIWSNYTDTSGIEEIIKLIPNPDSILSSVIRQSGNVTSSFTATNDKNKNLPIKKAGFVILGQNPISSLPNFPGSIVSLENIQQNSQGIGGVTLDQTNDGVIRRIPLFLNIQSNLFPSNISETIRIYQNTNTYQIKTNSPKNKISKNILFDSVRIGKLEIPTTKNGEIWLRGRLEKDYKIISALDVIEQRVKPEDIKSKIVIIGTNAEGLSLTKASPLSENVSGTEIYAGAIAQIISKDFLKRPDWFSGAELIISIIASSLFLTILFLSSPIVGAIFSATSITTIFLSGYYLLWTYDILFDISPLLISVISTYIFLITSQFNSNYRQKKQIRNTFERYLSPKVIQQLSNNPKLIQLGGEVRHLTILFCDIRKFTNISEQYSDNPKELVSLLNRFLTPLTSAILEHEGTVDKYMGDCIMAFWNAPLDVNNHNIKACMASKEMHKRIQLLNKELLMENRLPLEAGIGINSGIGLVGNVGSVQRFDYSVIGDTVNLAARLESQSKTYGFPTLVSEYVRTGDIKNSFIEIDMIRVKGKNLPVRIFALKDDISEKPNDIVFTLITKFIDTYRSQEWDKSKIILEKIRNNNKNCQIFCSEFNKRIQHFKNTNLDNDWDGVYDATSK